MPDPQDGAAILKRIQPKRRVETTELCLRPDLLDEHEALSEQLVESKLEDSAGNRMADGTSKRTKDLARKITALEEQIAELAMKVTFRSMDKSRWQALCDEHPPRQDNDLDRYSGFNRDAVLDTAIRECMVDPVFVDCEDGDCAHEDCGTWQQFVALLNPSEWAELRTVVNSVNRVVVESPKSELASRILTKRAKGSERPPASR